MKVAWGALLAAALLTLTPHARAQDAKLDAFLESVRAKYALPALAAAAVKDGEVIASGAVGVRAIGTDVPATVDDRFHLGSDTKAMTATLAGMMVDEGKLRWDSTIGEVLGGKVQGMNPALAAVTLEQLLSHTSGIPTDNQEIADIYFNVNAFDFNLDTLRLKALDAWKTNEPRVPEGAPFQYSNLGYMIAGAMIETAAGKPWEELIHSRIFEPLGLETAGLGPQATFGKLDAPVGHKIADGSDTPSAPIGSASSVTQMFWGAAADVPPLLGPAGVAHMSIEDFAKWAGWHAGKGERGPALVKPETLARLHKVHVEMTIENPPPGTPKSGGYAMGWGVVQMDWWDAPLLLHDGSNGMNLARVAIDVDKDFGAVIATNIGGAGAESALNEVAEHLFRAYGSGRRL
jgi:CubicO group peptidase (beta-lactamase class C family)